MRPSSSEARTRSASRCSRVVGRGMTWRTAAAVRRAAAPGASGAAGRRPPGSVTRPRRHRAGLVDRPCGGLARRRVGIGARRHLDQLGPRRLAQLDHERRDVLVDRRSGVGREHEAVLGPGHRDVEQASLLLEQQVAGRDGLTEQLAREDLAGLASDRPLPVEQVRDEDARELEPLRLVEGHQPDAVHVLGQLDAGRQLAAGGLVGVEVVHERGQAPGRVLGLPVEGEAQERGDVGRGPLRLTGVGGDEVEDRARSVRAAARGWCAVLRARSAARARRSFRGRAAAAIG